MFARVVADDSVYAQSWIQLSLRVNVCNTVLCVCLSKIWCHTMHLVSIVKLDPTISPEFYRAYCDLINETKRTENINISVVFFAESSLNMFAQRSNPLLYLWARSRWKIRLRDMTPSLKNIAWLKLFCSMFLIIMIKKSFRWGFNNNNGCCVIICVIYGLNWPIHP